MLTYDTAFEIVKQSIRSAGGHESAHEAQSLADIGFGGDKELKSLVLRIDEHVRGRQQKIDHAKLRGVLRTSFSVDDLTKHVMNLAAGKLCSNPVNPHQQICCPYPKICPQCDYPVY